uniref:G-protein coupled receptors family 1 profile domain-containing protein n=1 Tax=Biomphalaria glabrata TaxID=6526 RepID=A0A2C9L994_BIOGL
MEEKYQSDLIIDEIIVSHALVTAGRMQSSLFLHRIILCTITGSFGLVSNIINICVFAKQGLNSSINISFFALAITDVFRIVAVNWMNLCSSHIIQSLDVSFVLVELWYRTASWSIRCANRITLFTAVFITAERCLCIMVPLKVRKIVPPFKSVAVLITIDVFNVFGFVHECMPGNYSWTFAATQNKTLIALKVRSNSAENEGIAFTFHAVLMSAALLCVIIFTAVLVAKLNQKTQWRLESTSDSSQRETFKTKDRKTVKMVILVAAVMVVCYTPAVMLSVVSASCPEFNVTGPLASLFHGVWTVVFVLGTVNASVNIFIYYSMSTKYKEDLKQLMRVTTFI